MPPRVALALNKLSMSDALQGRVRFVPRSQHIGLFGKHIGSGQSIGTCIGDTMAITGPALSGAKVIAPVMFQQVRCFGETRLGTFKNPGDLADEPALIGVILLQENALKETARIHAVPALVPIHIHQPFAPVIVMKERRIKATGIQIYRVTPRPFDRGSRDQIIMSVLIVPIIAPNVRIDQPKETIVIGQTGGPDAAAIRLSAHVELLRAVQRTRHQRPVLQVG